MKARSEAEKLSEWRDHISSMESTCNFTGGGLPRFNHLRRIPKYQRKLIPWSIQKRYRCVVVGVAPGRLTVAITKWPNEHFLALLASLTRRSIFPVLIHSARMSLLIQRIERDELRRNKTWSYAQITTSLQIRNIVAQTLDWRSRSHQ